MSKLGTVELTGMVVDADAPGGHIAVCSGGSHPQPVVWHTTDFTHSHVQGRRTGLKTRAMAVTSLSPRQDVSYTTGHLRALKNTCIVIVLAAATVPVYYISHKRKTPVL